jgi:hypothetical protein
MFAVFAMQCQAGLRIFSAQICQYYIGNPMFLPFTDFPDSVIDAHVWLRFSQLAVGGLCGNVDIFDACVRKEHYQGTFEFTYVTKSQVRQGTCTEHINLLNVIATMHPVITSLQ